MTHKAVVINRKGCGAKSIPLCVKPITRLDCAPFIIGIHYAKRWPSISYAFGLFYDGNLEGVVTFGTPAGSPQRTGLLGPELASRVLELNRLCLRSNHPNHASFLVSRALKMIERPVAIISYADGSQGHIGIVYQATNAIYLGLSAKRTDWALKSKPNLHGQTIADEFKGSGRAAKMREKYGDDFYLKPRPRKHRYCWLLGSKGERKQMLKSLRYQQESYPKTAA